MKESRSKETGEGGMPAAGVLYDTTAVSIAEAAIAVGIVVVEIVPIVFVINTDHAVED